MTIPNKPMSLQLNKDQVRALNAELFAKFDPTKLEHMSRTSFYTPTESNSGTALPSPKKNSDSLRRLDLSGSPSTPKKTSSLLASRLPYQQKKIDVADNKTISRSSSSLSSTYEFLSEYLPKKPIAQLPKSKLEKALDAISVKDLKLRNNQISCFLKTIEETSSKSSSRESSESDSDQDLYEFTRNSDELKGLREKNESLKAENAKLDKAIEHEKSTLALQLLSTRQGRQFQSLR